MEKAKLIAKPGRIIALLVLLVMIVFTATIPVNVQAHCGQCEEQVDHLNPFAEIVNDLANIAEDIEEIHHDMHKISFSLRLISFAAIGIFLVLLLKLFVLIFKHNCNCI